MQNPTAGEADMLCEACKKPTKADHVNVTVWLGGELNVIEEVPAHVCESCQIEYFDPETQARIDALSEAGFPRWQAVREMPVGVFTIYGDTAALAVQKKAERKEGAA